MTLGAQRADLRSRHRPREIANVVHAAGEGKRPPTRTHAAEAERAIRGEIRPRRRLGRDQGAVHKQAGVPGRAVHHRRDMSPCIRGDRTRRGEGLGLVHAVCGFKNQRAIGGVVVVDVELETVRCSGSRVGHDGLDVGCPRRDPDPCRQRDALTEIQSNRGSEFIIHAIEVHEARALGPAAGKRRSARTGDQRSAAVRVFERAVERPSAADGRLCLQQTELDERGVFRKAGELRQGCGAHREVQRIAGGGETQREFPQVVSLPCGVVITP